MPIYPEIKFEKYHKMSFEEIDTIRTKIVSGEVGLLVNKLQSMAYLNQMFPKYSFTLKWLQNISIICFLGTFVVLFINWRVAPVIFIVAVVMSVLVNRLAPKFIFQQCKEDRVFLKFALATGLAKIEGEGEAKTKKAH